MADTTSEKPIADLEAKLAKLEEICDALGDTNVSLDEAVKMYAQGMGLTVECRRTLDDFSQQLEIIRQDAQKSLEQQPKVSTLQAVSPRPAAVAAPVATAMPAAPVASESAAPAKKKKAEAKVEVKAEPKAEIVPPTPALAVDDDDDIPF